MPALSQLLPDLGLELDSIEHIQALWAGYGNIYAVKARPIGNTPYTANYGVERFCPRDKAGKLHLILKVISPPESLHGDEGHLRKMFSYQVEQCFYKNFAPQLAKGISVAPCLGTTQCAQTGNSEAVPGHTATLLADLRLGFPIAGEKRTALNEDQALAAIDWLAKFHVSFRAPDTAGREEFLLPPLEEARRRLTSGSWEKKSLWLNGGYTYLATRRKEYDALARDPGSEWSAAFCTASDGLPTIAESVANFLTPCGRHFETFIHGDVKSENLFSNEAGTEVAFFDFQYVGLGLGVCDLVKLFTCSVPLELLVGQSDAIPHKLPMQQGELALLERYLELCMASSAGSRPDYAMGDLLRHWETALVDWCRFQASWGFWGNTGWLQARVRFILGDDSWLDWLKTQA